MTDKICTFCLQTGHRASNCPRRPKQRLMKINAFSQAQLIKLLLDGSYSCAELAEETGLHYVTILEYTRELHRAKAAHICMWEKDNRGRDMIKIYKLGEGKDAKRLKLTAAQRQQRVRDKKKMAAQVGLLGMAA
jgi:hypothetical protein